MAASHRFDPWSPPRLFPVHRWQRQRFAFRVSAPPTPCPQPLDAEQRRDIERHLLVSSLPACLRGLFFSTLRWEAKRRFPWSQERCAAGPGLLAQRRFPASTLGSSSVGWLRAMLIAECEIGMTTIQTPLAWLSRPTRNHALALRAAWLGQLAEALGRCPAAEPLAQEAERALAFSGAGRQRPRPKAHLEATPPSLSEAPHPGRASVRSSQAAQAAFVEAVGFLQVRPWARPLLNEASYGPSRLQG